MLNVFRENLRHLKWVLWLVAISMVLYLGYYFIDDDTTMPTEGWAAKVGDRVVSADEFLRAARRQDDFYRRLLGPQYEQLKPQIRLGDQVIQSLIDRRIALEEAAKLGLDATKEEIARRITDDPTFRDAAGNFVGKERYLEIVRNFWGNETSYEQAVAEDLTVEKWFRLVSEPARVGDEELETAYRSRNERAQIDYAFLSSTSRNVPTTVLPGEAEAWLRAHEDDYRRGESRRLKVLVLDRDSILEGIAVTDAEIEAHYRDNAAQFQRPERRRASQILLRVPAGSEEADRRSVRDLAESVAARARGGEDFASLARSLSQDPDSAARGGDLGFVSRGQREPALEQALFGTPVGEVSPVVESSLGFHVLKIAEAQEGGSAPLAEVRDGIRRLLQVRRADEAITAEAERLRGSVSTSEQLEAAAKESGRAIEEWVVVRDQPAPQFGASPEFLQAVFAAADGGVTAPARVARGIALAAVEETLPAAVPPLEEILERVKTDVLNDRAERAALDAARQALSGAGNLAGAAKGLSLEVKSSGDLGPGQPVPGAGRSVALDRAVFGSGAAVGDEGAVAAQGGALLYRITRLDAFDPARFREAAPSLREELLEQRRNVLVQSVLTRLRTAYAVEWNRTLVERANG
jgi:peptidyl-prolyl cis-trans isomerase D